MAHYGESKGKSLEAFLRDGERPKVIALLDVLMAEWHWINEGTESDLAEECGEVLRQLKHGLTETHLDSYLRETEFSSEYLDQKRALMYDAVEKDPTLAIGTAKELVESCCRTILSETGVGYEPKDGVGKLVGSTTSTLGVSASQFSDDIPEPETVRRLLGSLGQVANSLAELRNPYGSGHGKEKRYKGLSSRHARLAVGAALTLVTYLWDTYTAKTSQ